MGIASDIPKYVVIAALIGAVVIIGKKFTGPKVEKVSVNVPVLSAEAQAGKALFDANCKQCHGADAAGSDKGPTFINPIYRPAHHGDGAFVLAAKLGVRAHHWRFGNMPPQPQVGPDQVAKIVTYVRELQRANGVN